MICDSLSITEWFRDDTPWPPRQSPVYHCLDDARQHDSGIYTCVGSYRDNDGQEKSMRS